MRVLVTSPWVPAEWIKAHGHEPAGVWFEPGFGPIRAGLRAGVCPFAQRVLHVVQAREDLAFVLSTHCDQLRRAGDALGAPAAERCFLFNLPATWQTRAAYQMVHEELERLGDFLVRLGGRAPTPQVFGDQMEQWRNKRKELAGAGQWCPGAIYARALAQFHSTGTFELPVRQSVLVNAARKTTGKRPRLALIGGPLCLEDLELLEQMEALGGDVVLNATETGERTLAPRGPARSEGGVRAESDTLVGMVEASARDIVEQCVDVFQRPNTPLYAWLGPRLAKRGVEGLVLWSHTGCDLWRAEANSLQEAFKLPLLVLEADAYGGVSPRESGRLQAFLEALK